LIILGPPAQAWQRDRFIQRIAAGIRANNMGAMTVAAGLSLKDQVIVHSLRKVGLGVRRESDPELTDLYAAARALHVLIRLGIRDQELLGELRRKLRILPAETEMMAALYEANTGEASDLVLIRDAISDDTIGSSMIPIGAFLAFFGRAQLGVGPYFTLDLDVSPERFPMLSENVLRVLLRRATDQALIAEHRGPCMQGPDDALRDQFLDRVLIRDDAPERLRGEWQDFHNSQSGRAGAN
jgi:hypothetical protein